MKTAISGAVVGLLALAAASANAAPNLVTNGNFETNTGVGQIGPVVTATGWASIGTPSDAAPYAFNFIVDTNADNGLNGFAGGFPSSFSPGAGTNIFVWGPDNGSNNGFSGSKNGGFFLGGDGGYATAPVAQTINGLTVGKQYELRFEWAGAQFTDVTGGYWVGWDVSFGGQVQSVGGVGAAVASQGFRPWEDATMTFTASSTTQVLSFLATGPSGLPPFSLLDGVSLTEVTAPVPEPASLALLLAGLGVVGAAARRRRAAAA